LPPPQRLIEQRQQRLDELADRLPRALAHRNVRARGDLDRLAGSLRPALLQARRDQARTRLTAATPRPQTLVQRIDRERQRLDGLWRLAASLNPDLVLKRGYARVEADGHAITDTAQARKAGQMKLYFADGAVDIQIDQPGGASTGGSGPKPGPKSGPKTDPTGKSAQPSLF
jgi:exodeoxyribonuclease VII large subunit